jgi:hypothetical protein
VAVDVVVVGRRCPTAPRSEFAVVVGESPVGVEAVEFPVVRGVFDRAVVPALVEWLLPVVSAFESEVLWLDADDPPALVSALATAVPLASDAANPTATAPVPSHAETSLCCGSVRWRPLAR